MDQWARNQDRIELLGAEDNQRLIHLAIQAQAGLLNPGDLPGGFDFMFEGSDRVLNQVIRQRNLMNLDKRVGESVWTKQREWLKVLFESHDLSDDFETVIQTEEEMAAMLQMQAKAGVAIGKDMAERQNAGDKTGDKAVNVDEKSQATKDGREQSPAAA